MLHKFEEKLYRTFQIDGTEYSGRDGYKARGVDYIFDSFGESLKMKGSSVLDLGCAGGGVAFRASSLGATFVVGVERDERKLIQAKQIASLHQIDNVFFSSDSITNFLDHTEKQFDYVLLLNIIHHLPEPEWVLERVAEVATKGVIVEGPLRRIFGAYPPDRGLPRSNFVPWGPKQENRFFRELDFELRSSCLSPNAKSFIGGQRSLRFYERKPMEALKLDAGAVLKGRILIGPGTSGKTFAVQKAMRLSLDQSCAPYKFRDVRITRKILDSLKGIRQGTISRQNLYYIAPPVGTRRFWGMRLRGHSWNPQAWVKLAKKSNLPIVVLWTARKVRSERLLSRLQGSYLGAVLPQDTIQAITTIARDRSISDSEARRRLRHLLPAKRARFVLRLLMKMYLPNLDFSYERLFRALRSSGLQFEILDTGSRER